MIKFEPIEPAAKPGSKKGPKPRIVKRSKKKAVQELDLTVRDLQARRGDYKTR